jgi:uncharacterized membrane protein YGL010W
MYRLFCRQLAFYARYHRDPRNCATHYLGIPMLFLAAILPLQASHVAVGAFQLPLGIVLTLPVVIGWIALDFGVGATLLLLLCPLFAIAELIAGTGNALLMWSTATALFLVGWCFQFVGHAVFERRRPAFVDDLSQTLIGPMFVVAKMLVRLGLRRDLKPFLVEERQPGLAGERLHNAVDRRE